MGLLGLSFLAGLLTILAPCVLPLLPVILGGSVMNGKQSNPWRIITAFAVSVLAYTLLIKFLVDQFGLFQSDLVKVSAIILIVFGVFFLFPSLRQKIMHVTGIEKATLRAQDSTTKQKNPWLSEILLGVVLGPVFSSCSPTYALIIATVLPASFAWGLVNILAYIAGLVVLLAGISYGGRALINKLKWAANPKGRFRKIIALLIILVGVSMLMKRDKDVEARLLQSGYTIDTTQREIDQTKKFR